MSESAEFLTKVPLFALLDEDERNALDKRLEARRLAAGETLFSTGDPGGSLYIVKRGLVRIALQNTIGDTLVLAELRAGNFFGEVSLFDDGPRTASALAVEETDVLMLDREALLAFITHHPHAALDLLAVMGRRMRMTEDLLRSSTTRNLNEAQVEQMTFGQRVADGVAAFGGSWTFIILFGTMLVVWMGVNMFLLISRPFDPYPFILLNLVLSTLAALQAPVIMMSQNRQSAKDRLQAELDFEINLKAELEIAHLHRKIDRIEESLRAQILKNP